MMGSPDSRSMVTMAVLPALIVICLSFTLIPAYKIIGDDENEIVWPDDFHFRGEKYDFATGLKEPFEIWRYSNTNLSRIDLYGGISKKYFNEDIECVYSIYPMVKTGLDSEVSCFYHYSADIAEESALLPDPTDLTYTGETTTLFDKVVDIWSGTVPDEDREELVKEYTLYVYKTEFGVDIPVQYVIKTFNKKRGEIEDHVVKNYYDFVDTVDENDVTVPNEEDCEYGFMGQHFKKYIQVLQPDTPGHVDIAFEGYTKYHGKNYHAREKLLRKQIFEKNWRKVQEHNSKDLGWRMEINQFADQTPEELRHLTGLLVSNEPSTRAVPFPHTQEEIDALLEDAPQNFDMRMEGVITQVKHQGSCGSCWAFATTSALEGALARINGGRLVDLSEQSLVDCAWTYGNYGCDGGMLDSSWTYVLENGMPTEQEYGIYMENDGFCNIHNMSTMYHIKGFVHITPRNGNAMKLALQKYGPVTVAIYASDDMLYYSSGVYYDFECETASNPNHAVTVIGYGVRDGQDYWLVKNSWSESWGEDGYILMSAKNDNCLLLEYAYYPIV